MQGVTAGGRAQVHPEGRSEPAVAECQRREQRQLWGFLSGTDVVVGALALTETGPRLQPGCRCLME